MESNTSWYGIYESPYIKRGDAEGGLCIKLTRWKERRGGGGRRKRKEGKRETTRYWDSDILIELYGRSVTVLSSILSYPLWCACISHSFSLSIDDRLLCGLVSEFLRERSPAMIVRQLPLAARLTLRVGTRAGPTLSTSNDGRKETDYQSYTCRLF